MIKKDDSPNFSSAAGLSISNLLYKLSANVRIVIPGAYSLAGSILIPPKLSDKYFTNMTAPKESTPIEAKCRQP